MSASSTQGKLTTMLLSLTDGTRAASRGSARISFAASRSECSPSFVILTYFQSPWTSFATHRFADSHSRFSTSPPTIASSSNRSFTAPKTFKSGGSVSDTNRNGNIPEPLAGPCNHPQLQPERVASPCNLTPATASGHCVTTQSTSARARAHCRALQSTPAREIADCTATQSAKAAPEADCVLKTVTFKPISDRFLQEKAFFRQVIQRPGAHPSRVLSMASSRRSPHFGWKPK